LITGGEPGHVYWGLVELNPFGWRLGKDLRPVDCRPASTSPDSLGATAPAYSIPSTPNAYSAIEYSIAHYALFSV
jgi:hypothetical protein